MKGTIMRRWTSLLALVVVLLVSGVSMPAPIAYAAPAGNVVTPNALSDCGNQVFCLFDGYNFGLPAVAFWNSSFAGLGCVNLPAAAQNRAESAANKWSFSPVVMYSGINCTTVQGRVPVALAAGRAVQFGMGSLANHVVSVRL